MMTGRIRMNPTELKQAIAADIDTLKTLDLEIMSADEYYRANLMQFRHVFLKIYCTIIGSMLLAMMLHLPQMGGLSWDLFVAMVETFGLALGLVAIVFLFIYDTIAHYIIVKNQLRHKLKTGDVIVEKFQLLGKISYRIFATIVITPAFFLDPGCVLVATAAGFFITAILTGIIIDMETNRIGISTLMTLINKYFDKKKTS